MKRTPLARRSPLARSSSLRRSPLPPTGRRLPKSRPHTIPADIRQDVLSRAQGRCEGCSRPCARPVLHHRRRRSQGGPDAAWNLAALHGACHRLVHEQVALAEEFGLLLRAGQPDLGIRPALWLREAA